MKQILFNLIGNAIKFTFDGYVKIEVSTSKVKNKKCLNIAVQDTGIGMTKMHMQSIFEMFQLADSQDGNKSGTGLGLYISKNIARKLTVEGDEGIRVVS